ncbi:MAG: hypothetical protein OHK0029_33550 [Armatimonadaceae bacterium]
MRCGVLAALVAAVVFLLAPCARADELVLKNGDRLTGTVDSLAAGKLVFKTAKAGTVTVSLREIRSLTTEKPFKLMLQDRTTVTSRLVAADNGLVTLTVEGEARTLPLTQIAVINPGKFRWIGGVSAGLTLLSNLINTQTFNVSAEASRKTPTTETSFDAAYLLSRQEDVTTENAAFLNGDYLFGKGNRRFGFVNGALRTDRIQRLNLRVILGTGIGYEWLQGGNKDFRTDIGLSYRGEDFEEAAFRNRVAANVGYNFRWKLRPGTTFTHELNFLPTLTDLGDNYLLAQFSLDQALLEQLYFNARVILDRTSRPGPNAARETSKVILGIGVRF